MVSPGPVSFSSDVKFRIRPGSARQTQELGLDRMSGHTGLSGSGQSLKQARHKNATIKWPGQSYSEPPVFVKAPFYGFVGEVCKQIGCFFCVFLFKSRSAKRLRRTDLRTRTVIEFALPFEYLVSFIISNYTQYLIPLNS